MTDAAVRRTIFSRFALPVFSWGLPFHSLLIAMLFGGLGLSAATVRKLAAWKEITVILMVFLVMLRAGTGKGPKARIAWLDIAVALLLSVAALFMLAGQVVMRLELPEGAVLYGMRDIAFFFLLYFVGRATPEIADDPNTLRRLYIITVLASAVAIVERIFVTPEMLVLLGVASYFQDFLNVSAFTAGNAYGLPMNYWTDFGSVQIQRAGSIFLSSQGFAVPFLLLLPIATAWVFGQKRVTTSMKIEYAIIWVGLLLSITRMTIVVCAIQLILVILMLKKPEWAVGGLVAGVVCVLVALFVVPGLPGFVWDTLTWQTGSSASHANDWGKGLSAFAEHPLGSGLATTDQAAVRFGVDPLTADNGYFKYAVELGIEGLVAFLAIMGGILATSYRLATRASTHTRRIFGTAVLFATIGILLNATTAVVFNALTLSYLFFWFAGAAVTVAQRESAPAKESAEVPLELAPA